MTMWRELIEALDHGVTFSPPATGEDLRAAARQLGGPLPPDLTGLLLETNEVAGEYDLGVVWTIDRIV